MIRLVSIFAGTLLVGVAVGSMLQRPQFTMDRTIPLISESPDLESLYRDSLESKEDVIANLTAENHRLAGRVTKLEKDLTEKSLATMNSIPEGEVLLDAPGPIAGAAPERDPRERRRRGEPPNEETRARMREFIEQAQAERSAAWDKQWMEASPESQERISAIAKYQQDLMDIGAEIRTAETDEERQAIFEEMRGTRDALNETLKIERNAQLGNLAEHYGIDDEADVKKFVRDMQQTLKSPVFQTNTGRGGGFGGSGGGGFRGPGGGRR